MARDIKENYIPPIDLIPDDKWGPRIAEANRRKKQK